MSQNHAFLNHSTAAVKVAEPRRRHDEVSEEVAGRRDAGGFDEVGDKEEGAAETGSRANDDDDEGGSAAEEGRDAASRVMEDAESRGRRSKSTPEESGESWHDAALF